jgi:hypothetical protein
MPTTESRCDEYERHCACIPAFAGGAELQPGRPRAQDLQERGRQVRPAGTWGRRGLGHRPDPQRRRLATPARTNRHSRCARRPPGRSPRFPPRGLCNTCPDAAMALDRPPARAGVAQALTLPTGCFLASHHAKLTPAAAEGRYLQQAQGRTVAVCPKGHIVTTEAVHEIHERPTRRESNGRRSGQMANGGRSNQPFMRAPECGWELAGPQCLRAHIAQSDQFNSLP